MEPNPYEPPQEAVERQWPAILVIHDAPPGYWAVAIGWVLFFVAAIALSAFKDLR